VFEINGLHIVQLNDTDLRILVDKLCQADVRRAGWSVSAVTAGGDQNAKDGGLDVRVELPDKANPNGFIPRNKTGFQVKKPDMQPKAIVNEMRPSGILRPLIEELASLSGAYIIVSAKASASETSLKKRRKAMRDAVADSPNAAALWVDFYDSSRLANWVNDHPGLIAWVKEKIGQPIQGWQPYGDWSKSGAAEAPYLLDDTCRLFDNRTSLDNGLPIEAGIQRMREVLAQPKGVVRLVGLSGTGKTRLVQALFDDRAGQQALASDLAFYTDEADEPVPAPRELMRRLIQESRRAIVMVDNCLPETHRALTAICTEPSSKLSLITVEFDVGEDEPEKTEVFRLEPASEKIIEALIQRQCPEVSQADRYHIAAMSISGGNARMALALARTVQKGESIAKLTDNELFKRLIPPTTATR